MEKYVPRSAKGAPVRFLAVSAHKDDIEMFALDGIFKAYAEGGFAAAVLTDGGQCPRSGAYAAVSDEDMALLRSAEQKRAAEAGAYEALWLFEKTSAEVKRAAKEGGALVEELAAIMRELPPLETLYIHNPFDSHPTHAAACVLALQAARLLPPALRPARVLGCELWRDLDWLTDADKVAMDVSGSDALAASLMSCFVSQNAVKRYDIASLARRAANATFYQSHEGDSATALVYGVDMTCLLDGGDIAEFAEEKIAAFRRDLHI